MRPTSLGAFDMLMLSIQNGDRTRETARKSEEKATRAQSVHQAFAADGAPLCIGGSTQRKDQGSHQGSERTRCGRRTEYGYGHRLSRLSRGYLVFYYLSWSWHLTCMFSWVCGRPLRVLQNPHAMHIVQLVIHNNENRHHNSTKAMFSLSPILGVCT